MTRMTDDEIQLMDMLIETVDYYLNEHRSETMLSTYELVSEYFSELADNERSKLKITVPTDNDNWKLEL